MRIMGLDLGNKTLGVAISDSLGMFATGYPTIRFKSKDFDTALTEVLKLIEKEKVDEIVLGLPKNMDGSLGEQAQISLEFQKKLEEASKIKVNMLDERLTSRIGLSQMIQGNENKKTRHDAIDEAAAKVILQDYLDMKRGGKK